MKAIFIDIDGTLLNSQGFISEKNINSLQKLKDNGFIVVLSTGRSPFSAFKVIDKSLPIDYLVFSTGIGIMDFSNNKILVSHSIDESKTNEIVQFLNTTNYNYFVHTQVPDNHKNFYRKFYECPSFNKRIEFFNGHSAPISKSFFVSTQFIVFLDNDNQFIELEIKVNSKFPELSTVRATSPYDMAVWFEIYPENINKGYAVKQICDLFSISETYSIGNDYNDISMLDNCFKSFVVDNSPQQLKNKYTNVASNDSDGVSEAIELILSN